MAVAVIVYLSARVRETLHFLAFCELNHPEIRITITPSYFISKTRFYEARLHPILKMELLVLSICALDHDPVSNGLNAPGK